MNQQEAFAKLQAKKAEWEDAKSNLAPHLATHRGIDSLFSFLEDLLFKTIGGAAFDEAEQPPTPTHGIDTAMVAGEPAAAPASDPDPNANAAGTQVGSGG